MDNKYFDSIISSGEYVEKLQEVIDETIVDIQREIEEGDKRTQRINALQLVHYKLGQCSKYLAKGRKELRDLSRLEKVLTEKANV